ncbi:MAG: hypothetical protein J1E41_03980 [Ruminococcus sp.]|nr:hypothetical protein [Ruminococcus sp.]
MDKLDKEITDFLIYNEVMKNSNNTKSRPHYSGSSSSGCSSPTLALILIVLSIIGWIWFIASSCVSCASESSSHSNYHNSYSNSYSSRTYSSSSAYSSSNAKYDDDGNIEVPYVGMSESKISDTSLGSPSSNVRHNYQVKNGEQYLANLYDFYQDGACVFTARCVQGRVTQVWDSRDNPVAPYKSHRSKSSSSKSKTSDPYNAKDYYDADDFYYDNYDDFWDYEDAEDYYNEHKDD